MMSPSKLLEKYPNVWLAPLAAAAVYFLGDVAVSSHKTPISPIILPEEGVQPDGRREGNESEYDQGEGRSFITTRLMAREISCGSYWVSSFIQEDYLEVSQKEVVPIKRGLVRVICHGTEDNHRTEEL